MDKQSFDEHWPPVMEGLDFANKDNLGQLETDKKSWGGRLVGLFIVTVGVVVLFLPLSRSSFRPFQRAAQPAPMD